MESRLKKAVLKKKRALRVRKRVKGTESRPRLCVVKTNTNLYVQAIDDTQGRTICSASTLANKEKKNVNTAAQIGASFGEALKALGVEAAVFDRGPFKYHGVIKALADGIRNVGIKF